jgi:alanyl-tRNA synthetase
MSDTFPEIRSNQSNIEKIIKAEEESFNATLDRGIELFDEISERVIDKNSEVIKGEDVFKLYDTFGFPVDLTNVMAQEKGLKIDLDGFNILMERQKERARKFTKEKLGSVNLIETLSDHSDIQDSEFEGYDKLETDSRILRMADNFLILDRTPFYAEAGGQIGDTGILTGTNEIKIINTIKHNNIFAHEYEGTASDDFSDKVVAKVDKKRRWEIMRNHTATHFLHSALRQILGTHVKQAGSYVGPDRLRFDFAHFQKVSAEELQEIESLVNHKLHENIELQHHRNIPFEEAKKMGALMFFGDKYGDKVNVVQFSDFSLEFCGGTHVHNSSQIGLFKIISESSIASGVRRIEAVTGLGVERFIQNQLQELRNADEKIAKLNDEKKKIEKELSEFKLKEKLGGIDSILENPGSSGNINIYKGKVDAGNMDELKSMGDELREKIKSGVGV